MGIQTALSEPHTAGPNSMPPADPITPFSPASVRGPPSRSTIVFDAQSRLPRNGTSSRAPSSARQPAVRAAQALATRDPSAKADPRSLKGSDGADPKADPKQEREQPQPKDEWQERSSAEQRSREEQQLREEERRLKKKVEEQPNDEESTRRLKKVQRELERLHREAQQREEREHPVPLCGRDLLEIEPRAEIGAGGPQHHSHRDEPRQDIPNRRHQQGRGGTGPSMNRTR